MKQVYSLAAEPRQITGRRTKQLRTQGLTPANIYGPDIDSVAIQVNTKTFINLFHQAGETQVVNVTVTSQDYPVLIQPLTLHPVTHQLVHVDLRKVDLTQKITANVPIEIVGESEAVHRQGGVLVQHLDEVEVESLPSDIPEKITIDISLLDEMEAAIHIADLDINPQTITLLHDPEEIVVKVEAPTKEEPEDQAVEESQAAKADEAATESADQTAAEIKAEE
jgi:large subunit ribosomal protein L25